MDSPKQHTVRFKLNQATKVNLLISLQYIDYLPFIVQIFKRPRRHLTHNEILFSCKRYITMNRTKRCTLPFHFDIQKICIEVSMLDRNPHPQCRPLLQRNHRNYRNRPCCTDWQSHLHAKINKGFFR